MGKRECLICPGKGDVELGSELKDTIEGIRVSTMPN